MNAINMVLMKLFMLLLIFCCLFMLFCCTSTPKIKNGIAELRTLKIGSVQQTILIRGENIENPIILYLHGGPGSTEMIPFRLAHKNLEKYFTIVSWEQRGTGKSYTSKLDSANMTVDQFISDTHELTKYLQQEFCKEKIILLGHSWGTLLGLLTIDRYPEDYFVYVGSGQDVNPSEGEKISYAYVLEKAQNNKKALKELTEINENNSYLIIDNKEEWFKKIKIQRKWLVAFGGEIYQKTDYSLFFNSKSLFAPEYSLIDFIKFGQGSIFSLKTMWPEIMKINLNEQVQEISIPVFFLQGKHDFNTPTILFDSYYSILKSPRKEVFYFDQSAHNPMYEEPEKFEQILIDNILPLCK